MFELTGVITGARLGMPHGVLTVDADGEAWTVEVGQPWRNERAGLTDDKLAIGTEIVVLGYRLADEGEKRMKAERIRIAGTFYDLYPGRSWLEGEPCGPELNHGGVDRCGRA